MIAQSEMNIFRRVPRRTGRTGTRQHRGVAAVEFAIVLPIFLLVIFGMIEFGRAIMVQQVLTNASREGARRATIEGATQTEVVSVVKTYLTNSSITGATTTVSPSNLTTLGFGDSVAVTVNVPFAAISWTKSPWFLGGRVLEARTSMRVERLQ